MLALAFELIAARASVGGFARSIESKYYKNNTTNNTTKNEAAVYI
jgi:hypothetical protein